MRLAWLIVALIPYASIAVVDAWIHEKGRRVLMTEQFVHGGLALFLSLFIWLVFREVRLWAVVALLAFCSLVALDEIRFHRDIAPRERNVHRASWVALAGFVLVWYLIDR